MTTTYDPPTTNDPNATRHAPVTNDPDATGCAPRSAEQTTINAWSSSPLGDPAAETAYPFDGVGLSAFDEPAVAPNVDVVRAARPSRASWGLVLAAVLIGAVGAGTALGMFLFEGGPTVQQAPVSVVPGSNSAPIAPQTSAVAPRPTIAPSAPPASSVPSTAPAPAAVSVPDNGQGTPASPGGGSGSAPNNGPAPADTGTAPTDSGQAPSDPAPDPGSGPAPVNPPSGPTVVVMPPPVWLPAPPLPSLPTPPSKPTPTSQPTPTQTPPTQTPQNPKPPVVLCPKCFGPKI